jgi:hypothetical protein
MSSSNGAAVAVPLSDLGISHAFRPQNPAEPWGLCGICHFAESTHVRSEKPYVVHGIWRCPICVEADKRGCNHPRAGEQPLL